MVERFDGRVQREVLGVTAAGRRDLERLLAGFEQAYDARRQRVLGGKSPEEIVRERLSARIGASPTPAIVPRSIPCALPERDARDRARTRTSRSQTPDGE